LVSSFWLPGILKHSYIKTNSVAFSPQGNYTDWATATGRRIFVPKFVDRAVSRGQRGETPTAVNLSFLDWSRYFPFQVAPHLSSHSDTTKNSRLLKSCNICGKWKESTRRKIWGFHGVDYEECRLLGYKNPVRILQETHYVSTTELSQLMLCKIWGFHGNDYEECRLLGYKNPVRISQETHYVSAIEPSPLMLCKI
jgi:hypothetical protein